MSVGIQAAESVAASSIVGNIVNIAFQARGSSSIDGSPADGVAVAGGCTQHESRHSASSEKYPFSAIRQSL